jgi:hypothetical protein
MGFRFVVMFIDSFMDDVTYKWDVNIINRDVNEQNSLCVGVISVTTIIEFKLTLAVSSQLTGTNRI